MFRHVPIACAILLACCLLSVDAQDVKKKKPPVDTSSFSGKITDVNLGDDKKLESLYVQSTLAGRPLRRNVRINPKTQFEYAGFKDKADEKPRVGDLAAVKIDPDTDYALTIKVTAAGASAKIVPKKDKK